MATQEISPSVKAILEKVKEIQHRFKHNQIGTNHWLLALIERHGALLERMATDFKLEEAKLHIEKNLGAGMIGENTSDEVILTNANDRAHHLGKRLPNERDISAVVLALSGYHLVDPNISAKKIAGSESGSSSASDTLTSDRLTRTVSGSLQETETVMPGTRRARVLNTTNDPSNAAISRIAKPTPVLNQFGRDLTQAARDGKLTPIVGREDEIMLVIETLCRRTKRNPVLVGPAGVGKTAIVEGFAQRIITGMVPDMLKDARVVALQPSTLVAGASVSGELEKRMKALISEASQEGLILFIDELHSAIGAGGMVGTNDIASILKPVLARGELACIAATTDDEYRRFIEPDTALERRFQPIRINELNSEQTLQVLTGLRGVMSAENHIDIGDDVLAWIVEFGQQYMRNRHFPDKAVDMLEQCYAFAITQDKKAVTLQDSQAVAQRMIGMPISLGVRLRSLREKLQARALLEESDVYLLSNRLQVTLRGLDMRLTRPNAVILLTGDATGNSDVMAETLSECLFGEKDRIIKIDFSRFWHPEDVNLLVGAPPGYVGYSDSLPIHRVAQIPWSVLLFQNIDACHPQVRELIARALADGFFTDGRGKVIYLSDTIILMTAGFSFEKQKPLGFVDKSQEENQPENKLPEITAQVIGVDLTDQIDLFVSERPKSSLARRSWIECYLLPELSNRYHKMGLNVAWDDSLITWLASQENLQVNDREWEKFVDQTLNPELIAQLPEPGSLPAKKVVVSYLMGRISANPVEAVDTSTSQAGSEKPVTVTQNDQQH